MKIRLFERTASLALAVLVTLCLFGSIDQLAVRDGAGAVWAAMMTPRA